VKTSYTISKRGQKDSSTAALSFFHNIRLKLMQLMIERLTTSASSKIISGKRTSKYPWFKKVGVKRTKLYRKAIFNS
jgi:hypothetical protein